MSIKRTLSISTFSLVLLLSLTGLAVAKEITVDDNRVQCKKADFTSVQAAVNAASAGDNIKVCPGTYTEQVTITKSNITLFSEKPLQAVIKAPAVAVSTTDYALVRIAGGARDVKLRGFTISGPLPDSAFCSDSLQSGIRVVDGSSATITDNYITEIRSASASLRGCQNGFAIAVGRQYESQSGSADITKNVIDKYQKGGIYADGLGTNVTITNNTIKGSAGTPDADVIAPNGVQVSRSATAVVRQNEITNNVYTPQTFGGSGIIMFDDPTVTISHNKVNNNDLGILLDTMTGDDIAHNTTNGNTFDGISLYATTGATVEHNVSNNNGYDGIFVWDDAVGNTLRNNKMSGNAAIFAAGFDAEDLSAGTGTGGTANIWFNNKCTTDNLGGELCN